MTAATSVSLHGARSDHLARAALLGALGVVFVDRALSCRNRTVLLTSWVHGDEGGQVDGRRACGNGGGGRERRRLFRSWLWHSVVPHQSCAVRTRDPHYRNTNTFLSECQAALNAAT